MKIMNIVGWHTGKHKFIKRCLEVIFAIIHTDRANGQIHRLNTSKNLNSKPLKLFSSDIFPIQSERFTPLGIKVYMIL